MNKVTKIKRAHLIATTIIAVFIAVAATIVCASESMINSIRDKVSVEWSKQDQQDTLENSSIKDIEYSFKCADCDLDHIKNYSVKNFLVKHSGFILSLGPAGADLKEAPMVRLEEGQLVFKLTAHTTSQIQNKPPELGQRGSGGGAVPISSDGYFLTACHVVDDEKGTVLAYWSKAKGKAEIQSSLFRNVFQDEESDFAIIKADLKTPEYLSFRESPLESDEILFSGSWINSKAAGRLKSTQHYPSSVSNQYGYSHIKIDIPAMKGDSGSPLIDRFGKLCGVMIRSNRKQTLWRKYNPESTAVIMKADDINAIIDQDRKLQSEAKDNL